MMKITQDMRDTGVPNEQEIKKAIDARAGAGDGQTTTTDLTSQSDKNIINSTNIPPSTNVGNSGANNEDISPEGLLNVISQEWKNEMVRIVSLGLNGYKRRKESRNDCLV